jgi:DnaJ-class molecular chaperone
MEVKNLRQSLYEVLEVSPDAPQEEIHQAFLRAKHTYSSDSPALYSVFSKEEAHELLKLIEDAYAVLGNPHKRKEYDDKAFGKAASTPLPSEKLTTEKFVANNSNNKNEPTITKEMLAEADVWAEAKVISKPESTPPVDVVGRTALS